MAGYSGTPLAKKLGLRPGTSVHLIHPPAGYLKEVGASLKLVVRKHRLIPPVDFIHLFASDKKELLSRLPNCCKALSKTGMLWISWPRKASGVATDLDEKFVRESGLSEGLVDVKVCAVDDTWSGLKFVFRLKDRRQAEK